MINCLLKCLGINEEQDDFPTEGAKKETLVKSVGIVVGHTEKSQGAVNYKGESEYSFNSRIAMLMRKYIIDNSPKKCEVLFRDIIGRSGVAKSAKNLGLDLTLELHFNSFNKVAYGCEILVYQHAKEFDTTGIFADELTDLLAKKFDLKQRHNYRDEQEELRDGVKLIQKGDRGAYNLTSMEDQGIKYAMLIEPCFANIETKESRAIFENEKDYAELVAEYLIGL